MDSLLKAPDTPKNRSAFLEAALSQYVALLRRRIRDSRDLNYEEWTKVNKPKCGEKEEGPIEPPVLIKGM